MLVLAFVRRTLVIALAIAACVSLAHAGRSGTSMDEPARAHSATPPSATHSPAPRPLLRAGALVEEPASPPAAPVANADHSSTAQELSSSASERSLPANNPEHRNEKRERGKATAGTTAHVHRPVTQRAKGASRNTPATPGMGLLLRIGTTAEREISMLIDDNSHAPIAPRSGRAPPRASPIARPALASLPCASPTLATVIGERPSFLGAAPPASIPHRTAAAPVPARADVRPVAEVVRVPVTDPLDGFARHRLAHARRPKGAVACPTTPFGGLTA